jgi:homopolymeric O-antigen transport system permease protein
MIASIGEIYGSRGLLRSFLVRDLQVRYKASALGVLWSLLNPVFMMLVYTMVFSVVLPQNAKGIGNYPVWFLAGFLPWTFFATALQTGSIALLSNASLLQKVYFPRAVLPLSMTAANLVNFLIGFAVYLPFAIYVNGFSPLGMVALVGVTAALFLLAAGLSMVLSALTVYFRDVEFLLGLLLTAWFFLTPVVYQYDLVPPHLQEWLRLNPMLPFVNAFRDVLVYDQVPSAERLAACAIIGVVPFVVCWAWFERIKGRVVEEL